MGQSNAGIIEEIKIFLSEALEGNGATFYQISGLTTKDYPFDVIYTVTWKFGGVIWEDQCSGKIQSDYHYGYDHPEYVSAYRKREKEINDYTVAMQNLSGILLKTGGDCEALHKLYEKTLNLYQFPSFSYSYECGNCGGHGEVPCHTCGQTGKVNCYSCNGTGKTRCSVCNGQGQTQVQNEYYQYVWRDCVVCYGNGYVNCYVCSCTGKLNCRTCGGSGWVRCSDCGGHGFFSMACRARVDGAFQYQTVKIRPDNLPSEIKTQISPLINKSKILLEYMDMVPNRASIRREYDDMLVDYEGSGLLVEYVYNLMGVQGTIYGIAGRKNHISVATPILSHLLMKEIKILEEMNGKRAKGQKVPLSEALSAFQKCSAKSLIAEVMRASAKAKKPDELNLKEITRFHKFLDDNHVSKLPEWANGLIKIIMPQFWWPVWHLAFGVMALILAAKMALYIEYPYDSSVGVFCGQIVIAWTVMVWLSFIPWLGSRIVTTLNSRILPKGYRGRQNNFKPLGSLICLIYLGAGTVLGILFGLGSKLWPSWHYVAGHIWYYSSRAGFFLWDKIIEGGYFLLDWVTKILN